VSIFNKKKKTVPKSNESDVQTFLTFMGKPAFRLCGSSTEEVVKEQEQEVTPE
jgi:hypothetical protein